MQRLEEVFNKAQVQYGPAQNPRTSRCGNCEHWAGDQGESSGSASCRIVSGDIEANKWCILWNSREEVDKTFGEPETKREYDQGAVKDIAAKLAPSPEPRAGVIAPRSMADGNESEKIIHRLMRKMDLSEGGSAQEKRLLRSLLMGVDDKGQFKQYREKLVASGIGNVPSWSDRLYEIDLGMDVPGAGVGQDQTGKKREMGGVTFFSLKPPRKAPKDIRRKVNAKINANRGLARRIEKARDFHRSLSGDKFHKALGRYNATHTARVSMESGTPQIDGAPWFHGSILVENIGGVQCLNVDQRLLICSGTLPRAKFVKEAQEVWAYNGPFGLLDMELAFSKLSEGLPRHVRPWLKEGKRKRVMGLPNEGIIIVQEWQGKRKPGKLSFTCFDSLSGYDAMQRYQSEQLQYRDSDSVLAEAVNYGTVRTDSVDMIMDRVIKKLNVMNVLDTLQDAVFDNYSDSLYIFLNPELELEEVQGISEGLASEYPEIQVLGGPLDEATDWWVLWVPRPGGLGLGPDLENVLEPRTDPASVMAAPSQMDRAIRAVASKL